MQTYSNNDIDQRVSSSLYAEPTVRLFESARRRTHPSVDITVTHLTVSVIEGRLRTEIETVDFSPHSVHLTTLLGFIRHRRVIASSACPDRNITTYL